MNTIASLLAYKTWADAELFGLPEQVAARLLHSARQQQIAFTFTDGDAGRMWREEMLPHVVTLGGYHRGNGAEMLKGAGIGPSRDLYTRVLHAEQPSRRAAA